MVILDRQHCDDDSDALLLLEQRNLWQVLSLRLCMAASVLIVVTESYPQLARFSNLCCCTYCIIQRYFKREKMKNINIILICIFAIWISSCTNKNVQFTSKITRDKIPQTYNLSPLKKNKKDVEVVRLKGSNIINYPFDIIREHFSVPNQEEIIKGNKYISKKGGFSVEIPYLSTGKILVDQSEVRKGVDYQVRFYEKSVDNKIPWHAVVVSTPLPEEWEGKEERFFQVVKKLQFYVVSDLPRNLFFFKKISGNYGLLWETIIINRVATFQYPGSKAKIVSYLKDGYKTVGINRIGYINGKLIEIGIIVSKPKDLPDSEFMDYALKEMDSFHSGLKVFE